MFKERANLQMRRSTFFFNALKCRNLLMYVGYYDKLYGYDKPEIFKNQKIKIVYK